MNQPQLVSLIVIIVCFYGTPVFGTGLTITVNSSANDNTSDTRLTFVESLLIANDTLGRPLSQAEAQWVEDADLSQGLAIRFNIPGEGPHFIQPPPGGLPPVANGERFHAMLIDGYSQPGARPNNNPILAPNNAVLKLVLDCRQPQPHPVTGEGPDFTLLIQSHEVHIRGFSILGTRGTNHRGICFHQCFGGQISGCWLGLSPDQSIISGGEVAMGAWESFGAHGFGAVGDAGVPAEFNVVVAHAVGVRLDDTRSIDVSGNFIGVMPDGVSVPPGSSPGRLGRVAVQGVNLLAEIGIGSAAGLARLDQRNVIGGMQQGAFEFHGQPVAVRILGNYIGVGVDGTTALPPMGRLLDAADGSFVIGDPPEGPPREGSGNLIVGLSDHLVEYKGQGTFISHRGNRLQGVWLSGRELFISPEHSMHARRLGNENADAQDITPVLRADAPPGMVAGQVPVSGPGTDDLRPAWVDIYRADPAPPEIPQGAVWLAAWEDNGPEDLDSVAGAFRFALPARLLPQTAGVLVASTIRDASWGPLPIPMAGRTSPAARPRAPLFP